MLISVFNDVSLTIYTNPNVNGLPHALCFVAFVKMFTEIDFQPQGKSGLHLKSSGFSSKLLPSDFYQHL